MNFDKLPVEKPPVSEPKSAPKVVEQAKPVILPQPVQSKQPVEVAKADEEESSSDDEEDDDEEEDDEDSYSDDDEEDSGDDGSEDSYGPDFEAESVKKKLVPKKDSKITANKFAVRKTKTGASAIKRAKSPMAPHKWATKLLESPAQSAATEPIYGDSKRVDQAYLASDAIRRYRDELVSKERLVADLRKEIQTLRIMEKRQTKAIKELEQEKGNLPRVVQTITEENRVLKEKLRDFQSKYTTDEKILQEQHEEIVRLKLNVKEQQQVMKTKKLDGTSVGKKAKEELDEKAKRITDLQHKVAILEKSKEQDQKKFQSQLKEAHGETEKLKHTIEKLQSIAKQHNLGHLIKHLDDSSPVKSVLKNTGNKENASPTKTTKAKTAAKSPAPALPDNAKQMKSKIPVKKGSVRPLRRLDQPKKVNISDESDNESIHESSEDETEEESSESEAEASEKEEEPEAFNNSARGKPVVKMEAPALVPVQHPPTNQTLEALISPRQQPPYPKRSESPEVKKPATSEGINNSSSELEQDNKNKRDLSNPFTKLAEPITTRSSVAATTERLYRASTANANLHLHNHELSTNDAQPPPRPVATQDPPRNDIFKPNFGVAKKDRWKTKPF